MAASTRPLSRPQPLPVQRDGPADSRARNKENLQSPSPAKLDPKGRRRSFIPSLVQPSDKPDFFTDSYLADSNASQTSLIPSPLAKPATLSKPRKLRPLRPVEDQRSKPKHRSTRSEVQDTAGSHAQSVSRKPVARGTSPIQSTGLSTPPRSRDGSFTESPIEAQFSSPPRALTETYERIDQEEDLAATEGEISDPDSEPPQQDSAQMPSAFAQLKQTVIDPTKPKPKSRGSTPTNARFPDFSRRARDDDPTTASVLSDPTGMSFVNQLSDQNLAYALTPHMLQSAADKEALRKIWDSKKPIAFGKANRFSSNGQELDQPGELSPQLPPQRLVAFSKAGKRRLTSDLAFRPEHQRTFSDVTGQMNHKVQDVNQSSNVDGLHNNDLRREALPLNPRIHRVPYFSRTHGFPERQAPTELNGGLESFRKARSESPFVRTQPTSAHASDSARDGNESPRAALESIRPSEFHEPETDSIPQNQPTTQATSDVDWMQAAAADIPIQTIETNFPRRSYSRPSDVDDLDTSPEKSRKLDIDFTGQSFQVSESPPVRTKGLLQDFSREREIRGLARRAVTTNRLSQLRARESLERLRQGSKTPVSEVSDVSKEVVPSNVDLKPDGELVPDTPVVIYRSNSNGFGRKSSSTPPVRPSPDRSQSHDLLQRLARGSSGTSRSSTPSNAVGQDPANIEKQVRRDVDIPSATNAGNNNEDPMQDLMRAEQDAVRATPKVTGAWTDTILPDTIKTTRQTSQRVKYAETPHISAGGWIDTPAPSNQLSRLEPVPELTHEVPEELMNGIVKDSASGSDETILAAIPIAKPIGQAPQLATQSLAKKVLAEAKDRLNAQSPSKPDANADDSFFLGNATIQSLENVLDMDETDLTILSRIGEEPLGQSDTEVLDRLGSKLDRLRTHIHDARQGISKLESQMSFPEKVAPPAAQPTSCEVCGQPQSTAEQHEHPPKSATYLPLTLLTLTFPIPLLFRTPLPSSTRRLPKPTPLGWIVLAIWTWYLVECTLTEIYSHPMYASHYVWPDQQEPEFPFVLPTMLWRWSHLNWLYPYLVQPLLKFFTGLLRMVGMWCGFIDGFAHDSADTVVEKVVETVYQQAEAGIAGGLDMMNDEFL